MNFISSIVQKVIAFFQSGKAQAALTEAASLVPQALPIVEALAAIAPNRTDQEILAAFQKYAVPVSSQILTTPVAQRGYVLLQLATEVLAKNLPGVATKVLNAAVQLAVTGSQV
jgi:hypothetical protein